MSDQTPRADKPKTFEEALEKLEEIVASIESGKVPLEESISRYERGIGLVKQCRTILDRAEKKIQLLARGAGETLEPAGELDEPDAGRGAEPDTGADGAT
jgi:exodeoxyribonuclease VII small subunit